MNFSCNPLDALPVVYGLTLDAPAAAQAQVPIDPVRVLHQEVRSTELVLEDGFKAILTVVVDSVGTLRGVTEKGHPVYNFDLRVVPNIEPIAEMIVSDDERKRPN